MANAQLAEEELQQSVIVSEEDVEPEDVNGLGGIENNSPRPVTSHEPFAPNGISIDHGRADLESTTSSPQTHSVGTETVRVFHEDSDSDADEDADGEPDNATFEAQQIGSFAGHSTTRATTSLQKVRAPNTHDDDSDGEDDEGVGPVKIRPGEIDEEEGEEGEEEEETDSAQSPDDSDASTNSVDAAAWDDAPEGTDEYEESGESEVATSNLCIFCRQDEDNDPSEDFEEVLVCSNCHEISHYHCARESEAVSDKEETNAWMCPDCTISTQNPVVTGRQTIRSHDSIEADSQAAPSPMLLEDSRSEDSRRLRKRRTPPSTVDDRPMALRKRSRKLSEEPGSFDESVVPSEQSDATDPDRPREMRIKSLQKKPSVTILRKPESILIIFRVAPSLLRQLTSSHEHTTRRRTLRDEGSEPLASKLISATTPFLSSDVPPFYSFFDRDTDESRSRPYGGILPEHEAATTKTLPTNDDRKRFDEAKQKAEEEWRLLHDMSSQGDIVEKTKKSRKASGPASQIECIEFGGWEIDTWYAAPYPEEYSRNRILYICEFCLKYMNSDYVAWRHKLKCPAKHPPGDEIYRRGSISVFEVDGRKNPVYCQNLCLLAKLFLGSKTLYYDVEPFLFYVLCEYDELGYHFVGYFSKEKRVSSHNNVSCILTLPIHQRKGYGNLLIDFSYLLTRVERKTGSPEKPLSDMGLVSYRNYWRLILCQYLLGRWQAAMAQGAVPGLSIHQISEDTGLTADDVISALEGLRCLTRDPSTGLYAFRVDLGYCREYLAKWESKNYVKLYPESLTWTPYVMGRGNATNFELGPAITAIAPRDDEDDRKPEAKTASHPDNSVNPSGNSPMPTLESTAPDCSDGNGATKKTDHEQADTEDMGLTRQLLVRQSTESQDIEGILLANKSTEALSKKIGDWTVAYRDIPITRFEVFPALGARRTDRPRLSVQRPSAVRSNSTYNRVTRPNVGHVSRKSTAARPKNSSSSRRKTGGTGRGPGRWPKGTKKSDYGNASSGPGLPPGWIKENDRPTDIFTSNTETRHTVEQGGNLKALDTVRVSLDTAVLQEGAEDNKIA